MEFSDLALAKLLQTAPELGPFILNFSELSEELESKTVSVGVFSLRTGAGIAYIPVVAKDESVFPVDSVFLESEGRFLPLTKATITKLVSATGLSMGKTKDLPKSVTPNPDITNLINPPRTGKYVYASASRLTEFLADLPQGLKQFTFEKIAAEQSVYSAMDKMFGLKAIFSVLKAKAETPSANLNTTGVGPGPLTTSTYSVITTPREVSNLMDEALSAQFVRDGYAITGSAGPSRVAVAYQPYNSDGQFQQVSPATDGGQDFKIALSNGDTLHAYVPKYHKLTPSQVSKITTGFSDHAWEEINMVSIFEDGSYARGALIAVGDQPASNSVLTSVCEAHPPKLLKDCFNGEQVLLFTTAGEAVGPFVIDNVVLTSDGVDLKVSSSGMYSPTRIHNIRASRNLRNEVDLIGDTLYVQYNIIALVLGVNITDKLERNINSAQARREMITSQFLGSELNLRHDGVEFSINGKTAGTLPQAMKSLVEGEQIDPDTARVFLSKTAEQKFLKIFLTKKAATTGSSQTPTPTEISEYGLRANDPGMTGLNGSFMPAVTAASKLGDGQVLEATIISQLLQSPDLFEKIEEYLPEIQSAVDKLGRVLFLSRVKIEQLAEPMDSDSVFALIAQIKGVYRQLGDAATKLEQVSNSAKGFDGAEVAGRPAVNGV